MNNFFLPRLVGAFSLVLLLSGCIFQSSHKPHVSPSQKREGATIETVQDDPMLALKKKSNERRRHHFFRMAGWGLTSIVSGSCSLSCLGHTLLAAAMIGSQALVLAVPAVGFGVLAYKSMQFSLENLEKMPNRM